jgi:hypothetical protein
MAKQGSQVYLILNPSPSAHPHQAPVLISHLPPEYQLLEVRQCSKVSFIPLYSQSTWQQFLGHDYHAINVEEIKD